MRQATPSDTLLTVELPLLIDPNRYQALVSGRARGLGPGLQRWALWTVSWPYRWGLALRNALYDHGWKRGFRPPVPVVSVGNLTLGGTGKTPVVEYVARFYRQRGWQVAILSRGYGSSAGPNDEALVLEENLPDVPHLQGTNRATLASIAVEELESEVLVLDDGFQHRRLARDLDLVLLDVTQPWGHGYYFPRGLLREGPRSLRRAGVILLTRCDQVGAEERQQLHREIKRYAPEIPISETVHCPLDLLSSDGRTESLATLHARPALAFCGIGNPDAFRRTLQALAVAVLDFRTFPDHHAYTRADVKDLHAWVRQHSAADLVLTTQKDLVKVRLAQLGGQPLWAVRIGLHVQTGQEVLENLLESIMPNR